MCLCFFFFFFRVSDFPSDARARFEREQKAKDDVWTFHILFLFDNLSTAYSLPYLVGTNDSNKRHAIELGMKQRNKNHIGRRRWRQVSVGLGLGLGRGMGYVVWTHCEFAHRHKSLYIHLHSCFPPCYHSFHRTTTGTYHLPCTVAYVADDFRSNCIIETDTTVLLLLFTGENHPDALLRPSRPESSLNVFPSTFRLPEKDVPTPHPSRSRVTDHLVHFGIASSPETVPLPQSSSIAYDPLSPPPLPPPGSGFVLVGQQLGKGSSGGCQGADHGDV